jgi:3-hydroxybutyryl-CoA dehydrogenase
MIEKIGIIGAGQRGIGIAQICILAGYSVYLSDSSKKALSESLSHIDRALERQVARNKLHFQEKEEALKRLTSGTELKDMSSCDLVIESITENKETKKALFATLVPYLSSDCLLASNTSSFSITALAHATDRPDKFIGIHFLNPIFVVHLIELVRGLSTSAKTFASVTEVVKRLGKDALTSEDYPGFIVNRILMTMINEAIYALFEGVGNTEAIDKGMRLGTNHPIGPLEHADLIGLDVCMSILEALYKGLGNHHYKPCPLLVKYVEAGWLGRKTNRGFYDYTGEHPVPTYRRHHDIP